MRTHTPTPVLAVVIHFPSIEASCDGQANYLTRIVPALAEVGPSMVHIVAMRFGDQPETESGEGWTVTRVAPHPPLADVFAAYLPDHFEGVVHALAAAATDMGHRLGPTTPAWCHGYETGAAVTALSAAGHRVVGVAHYLVGIETLHDLAVGDDPVRRAAFDSPWATRAGRAVPRPLRPMSVRWAARAGRWMGAVPLPAAIRTQFQKLHHERAFVADAHAVVAVGPGFERAMNALYPCTSERSHASIAGAPRPPLPDPTWPFEDRPQAVRIAAVGRPTGQKGWDYLSAALHRLEREAPQEAARLELVVLGGLGEWSGPFSDFSARVAEELDALQYVRVANCGIVPHDAVLAHLRGAHALVHPAVFEPMGLVILEAMAAGCVVIAGDADGPRDLLEPPWGQLVAFSDPNQRVTRLTEALRGLLRREATDLAQAGAAAQTAAARHTWAHCAQVHHSALFPSD